MKELLITVLTFFIISSVLHAGQYPISGMVLDSITKEPVEGAAVYVKQNKKYLTTDKSGKFKDDTSSNKITIFTQLSGYQKYIKTYNLPFDNIVIELELASSFTLNKVHVKEKKRIEGTKQRIKIEQVNRATTHLFSDTMKILQTMPGVVTGNDFSSLMYVRGGEFYETACYLDNIFLVMPYMWGGNQSVFNPAFVDKVDFYSGGFPVKYPQALSAVIDVKDIEGNYDKRKGYFDLSATTFEIFTEGPMKKGKSSYVYGFRRTYYDLIMNLAYGEKYKNIVFPYFYDTQLKFNWKLGGQDKLYLNILGSYEGMDFDSSAVRDPNEDVRTFKFSYRDSRILPAVNYEKVFDDELAMTSTLSLRNQDGAYDLSSDNMSFNSRLRQYDISFKNKLTYAKEKHTIETGLYTYRTVIDADIRISSRKTLQGGVYYYENKTIDYDLLAITAGGAYLQDDIELCSNKLFLNVGGLGEYLDLTHDMTFSPRGGIKYLLTENASLKFNTGLYSQFPVYGVNGPPPVTQNRNIKSERSIHYVLGYELDLPSDYFFRLETYFKDYYDRVISDPNPDLDFTNNGVRVAQGIDLFVQKKPGGQWDGWFAYSYLSAKEKILERNDPANFAGKNSINDYQEPVGQWYPFEKERTHNMSVVYNHDFNKEWKIAVTYRFSTGTPYTRVTGVYQNGSVFVPLYGKYLDDNLPDYNRLDIKATMPLPFMHDSKNIEFYIQIINLFDTVNIDRYYYNSDYSKRYTARMLPRIPVVGVKYNF